MKKLVDKVFSQCLCHKMPFSNPTCTSQELSSTTINSQKICGGHEVDVRIQRMEEMMDIKGDSIATLLCYLEKKGYLEITNILTDRDICRLHYYGGERQLEDLKQNYTAVEKGAILKKEGIY